jgi:hypothetical protein
MGAVLQAKPKIKTPATMMNPLNLFMDVVKAVWEFLARGVSLMSHGCRLAAGNSPCPTRGLDPVIDLRVGNQFGAGSLVSTVARTLLQDAFSRTSNVEIGMPTLDEASRLVIESVQPRLGLEEGRTIPHRFRIRRLPSPPWFALLPLLAPTRRKRNVGDPASSGGSSAWRRHSLIRGRMELALKNSARFVV